MNQFDEFLRGEEHTDAMNNLRADDSDAAFSIAWLACLRASAKMVCSECARGMVALPTCEAFGHEQELGRSYCPASAIHREIQLMETGNANQ